MEFLEKLSKLEREIPSYIIESLPENWHTFFLYTDCSSLKSCGLTYYYSLKDAPETYFNCYELKQQGFENEVNRAQNVITEIVLEMLKLFSDNGQELWYNYFMKVQYDRKAKMEYQYIYWPSVEISSVLVKMYYLEKYIPKYYNLSQEDIKGIKKVEEYINKYNEELKSNNT